MTKFILEIRNRDGFSDIAGLYIVRDSCRLTALIKLLVAVQRQRVLYTETIEFASWP